jgi:hypothetical protein
LTGAPRAKRRPAKARSAPAEPPAPKHRTDEEERAAHSEAGARGRKVNGVKALCAGFSYEQVPYWLSARVYLIHSMPDISTLRDAPSPGQSRGPIGPRGRSLQRRQKSGALLSLYVTSTIASLPRLVTPAKAPDMAAQLQGMLGTPLGFVSAKIKFLTVGSLRNGHPQI